MTEYEMAQLANELRTLIAGYGTNMLTIVSAFLVASFVVAHRLNKLLAGVVVTVFSYWYIEAVRITTTLMMELQGLREQIKVFAHDGKGLAWHAFAAPPSQSVQSVEMGLGLAVTAVVYIGSLAFFFHCRRMNGRAEAPLTVPPTAATTP